MFFWTGLDIADRWVLAGGDASQITQINACTYQMLQHVTWNLNELYRELVFGFDGRINGIIEGGWHMNKIFYCLGCGTHELRNLFITTHTGKSLSLLLSSESSIRKSSGDIHCVICGHVGHVSDFHN